MTAVWRVALAQTRVRWRALLAVALLGIGAGSTIALAAGAARSSTVVERFRAAHLAADVTVQPDTVDPERLAALRADPAVAAAAPFAVIFARVKGTDVDPANESEARAAVDATYGSRVDRPELVAGRPLDPRDPHAVQLSSTLAREAGVGIGDSVVIETLTPDQVASAIFEGQPVEAPAGPELSLRVTSIVRPVEETLSGKTSRSILITPALWAEVGAAIGEDGPPATGPRVGGFENVLFVRATAEDPAAAMTAARRVFAEDDELFVQDTDALASGRRDLARVMALALTLAAGVAGLAVTVIAFQAVTRDLGTTAEDAPTLAALGMTRRDRAVAVALPVAGAALAAAAVAVVVAVAWSSRFPLGELRSVEPHPGLDIDGRILGLGAITTALLLAGWALTSGWSAQRHPGPRAADERLALTRLPAPVVATTAARLATRRGVPLRPALAGVLVAIIGVTAATTFGASLARFVTDPARDGWAWDGQIAVPDGLDDRAAVAEAHRIAVAPVVHGLLLARVGTLDVGRRSTETQVYGIRPVEGAVSPSMLAGRLPVSDDEVVVGPDTARDNHVGIGDRLVVAGPKGRVRPVITGVARLPALDVDDPAQGLVMTMSGLARIAPSTDDNAFGYLTAFARWTPGVTTASAEAALGRDVVDYALAGRSSDATNLETIRLLPLFLAVGLAVLGALAVAHALATTVRLQRRDLAVLRCIGFVRSQVRWVVRTQALGYAAAGIVVGIPLGLVAGRWAWRVLAERLGAASDPLTPGLLVIAVPLALAVALAIAALPARAAAAAELAPALRHE